VPGDLPQSSRQAPVGLWSLFNLPAGASQTAGRGGYEVAVHARRWSTHYEGAHRRRWHTLGADIGLLKQLLTNDRYSPTDDDVEKRRQVVAGELVVQFTALENTPARRGLPRRNLDIRRRVA
jgi:hypothetical protein